MVEEMLWCLVELAVAATTEEGYPQMLPRMTIGCGRVLIHHTTIWAERSLVSLVVIIIDGHLVQAFHLVELVNHILPFILKWHIWGYDGYQGAMSLSVEEWAQARYLLGDTGSGVQGQPFIFIFEGIGLALGQVTLAVEVVDPMFTYNSQRTSFVDLGGPFTSNLCTVLLSKLCPDPCVPGNELRDALGNVVRRCASSLLGSYIHQELI